MTTTTHPHPDLPRPAGTEFYEPEWRRSPNGAAYFRRFASKKFPVFDGLTVQTGGVQLVTDDGREFTLREMRIVGSVTSLADFEALQLAQALTDATAYIAELQPGDPGTETA
jgi:hypothetical protein